MKSSSAGAILAVDAGGTRTRAIVASEDGRRSTGQAGPANWTTLGPDRCVAAVNEAVELALEAGGLSAGDLLGACLSMAGYYPAWHEGEVRSALHGLLPEVPLRLEPDLVAAWAGATGGRSGAVLVVGTGAVVYARDAAGRSARSGGWGPLYGDEGSGYWIGCEALRAAARALDGRGPQTALSRALVSGQVRDDHEGASPPADELTGAVESCSTAIEEALRSVYRDGWRREQIASLSPTVARLASQGDPVCQGILERAAGELTELVAAVAGRLSWTTESFTLSAVGGTLDAGESLRAPLERRLAEAVPHVVWEAPRGTPVEGALILAREEATRWPTS